jgi:hypothetical protein
MEDTSADRDMSIERRNTPDQRQTPTRPLGRYSLIGRRKKARRADEDKNYYVDRYEPRYFVFISLILLLCVLDAYFTLKILDFGGQELNILMFKFIYNKPISAMVVKYLGTALGVIFILIHKNFIVFNRIRVYHLIYMIFLIYFVLVMYEAVVFFQHIRLLSFFSGPFLAPKG